MKGVLATRRRWPDRSQPAAEASNRMMKDGPYGQPLC